MKLHILKMRKNGIVIPKRHLFDRFNSGAVGELEIGESSDQGLHRIVKRAKFTRGQHSDILFDVTMQWMEGDRFVLSGFERSVTPLGEVEYAQSWLCIMGDVPEVPHPAR
ncbi:hypothetical protein ACO0K2_17030 [Undibacterium sp. MH2W]|uniref:hypothetical protein n=1 Tax=Undibacterium sp. MH2W TaxID=3413044 RepID=UPI003BF20A4E